MGELFDALQLLFLIGIYLRLGTLADNQNVIYKTLAEIFRKIKQ